MNSTVKDFPKEIAKELNIPIQVVEGFLNSDIGTKWIIDKNLNISEVELAMFIKSIRKRLSFKHLNINALRLDKDKKNKVKELKKISETYLKFYRLHNEYYQKKKSIKKIESLLNKGTLIFEGGVSEEKFFRLLPKLLLRITPQELELSYIVNTLFRQRIAKYLEEEIKHKLYIRGSLLFFNSHSFGNGYLANFCHHENKIKTSLDTYVRLQGSDLDVKYIVKNDSNGLSFEKTESIRLKLNNYLRKYNNYLTIEFTKLDSKAKDSVWEVSDLNSLKKIFINKEFIVDVKEDKSIMKNSFGSGVCRKCQMLRSKNKIMNYKLRLGLNEVSLLTKAFGLTLEEFKVNKSLSEFFVTKWESFLVSSMMETNFLGYIRKAYLFQIFRSLFLSSGYRFSDREKKKIFNKIFKYHSFLLKRN